ncbi:hypothetical protein IQ270_08710 [Microcoleus sp. LEGE 07076]|uniref:hypothetical protein n=1 Tax=Microcoleus sp. LEGE 07076 TaxID=915322 RepID=UPI00187DED17|nr:hypothetical protein [Microcoleus sp. LEGE 07076]MBE9184789.1 hypothetical protein [Microcoleus sp. LEGE 07076]
MGNGEWGIGPKSIGPKSIGHRANLTTRSNRYISIVLFLAVRTLYKHYSQSDFF